MYRWFAFLLIFVFAGLSVGAAQAQGEDSDPYWSVNYWNNTTLSGTPAYARDEADINWDWGSGSPHTAVNADYFSARWERIVDFEAGTYEFTVTSDDGVRLYLDDTLIIDHWTIHPRQTYTAQSFVSDGHHRLTVEYFEQGGLAVAIVDWELASSNSDYWRGEYFTNTTLTGSPALIRDDYAINFRWGLYTPAANVVSSDRFSVRWTKNQYFAPGQYQFTVLADDGVRLWVDDHLLIDQWRDQPATTYSDSIYLSGDVSLKMEYYENTGYATAVLTWATGEDPPPPAPPPTSVVVDDDDAGFVRGGSAAGWRTVTGEGFGGQLTWTRNNDQVRSNYNWARWYPDLAPGRYEVFVFIPDRYTTTAGARYWISHYDGYTLRVVDQSANGDQWVSLGTYRFRGTSADYVSLSDITYERYLSRLVGFDAVRWDSR